MREIVEKSIHIFIKEAISKVNKISKPKIEIFLIYAENCVNYVTATIKEKNITIEKRAKHSQSFKKKERKKNRSVKQVVNERPSEWCDKRNIYQPNQEDIFSSPIHFSIVFHRIFYYFRKEKPQSYNI